MLQKDSVLSQGFFCIIGDIMQDILYNAAVTYRNLRNIRYEIRLGRKGKAYDLMIHFPADSFFHLVGMQHLADLKFSSTNKERIYKDILKRKINIEYLRKSIHYEEYHVEERIKNLYLLKDILKDNKIAYKINPKDYMEYSKIKAHYLMEYTDVDISYLFLKKEDYPSFKNEHKLCSFFKKHEVDYTRGTSKTTLLFIKQIIVEGNKEKEQKIIYINPSFKSSPDDNLSGYNKVVNLQGLKADSKHATDPEPVPTPQQEVAATTDQATTDQSTSDQD